MLTIIFSLLSLKTLARDLPAYCKNKNAQPFAYCYQGEPFSGVPVDTFIQELLTPINQSSIDHYLQEWEKIALESAIKQRNSSLNIFPDATKRTPRLRGTTCQSILNEIAQNSRKSTKPRSHHNQNENLLIRTDFFARHIQMALISKPWFEKTKELHAKIHKEKLNKLKRARDNCIKEQEKINTSMKSMSICQQRERDNEAPFREINSFFQEKENQYFKPLIQLKNTYPTLFKTDKSFMIAESSSDLANKILKKIPPSLKNKIITKSEKLYNNHIIKTDTKNNESSIDFLNPLIDLSQKEIDHILELAKDLGEDQELIESAASSITLNAKNIDDSLKYFCNQQYLTGSDKAPQLQHYDSLVDEFLNRQVTKANTGEISKEELDFIIHQSRQVQCHLIQKYPQGAEISYAALGGLTLLGSGVLAWASGWTSLIVQGFFLAGGTVLGGVGVKDYIDSNDHFHIGKIVVDNNWASFTEYQRVYDDLKSTRDIDFVLNIGLLPLSIFDITAVRSSYRAIKNLSKTLEAKNVSLFDTRLKVALTLDEMHQLEIFFPLMSKQEIEDFFKMISPMSRTDRTKYISKLVLPAKTKPNFSKLIFEQTIVDHTKDPDLKKVSKNLQNPLERYETWLIQLEDLYQNKGEEFKAILQSRYLEPSITKYDDIPEKYFEGLKEQARRDGLGDIEIDKVMRYQTIKSDQTSSLNNWINYLSSSETSHYPIWAKLWALKAVAKMGKYNHETKTFGRRRKTDIAPFAELNKESLAEVMDVMIKTKNGENIDEFFRPFIDGFSFSNLYSASYAKKLLEVADTSSVAGKWIKYKQGSDCTALVGALAEKGTDWCTANTGTAKKHLSLGDFHVFFTLDKNGEYAQPRVAIRMEKNKIAEIRGIENGQDLDKDIAQAGVVTEKMKEFGEEGVKYGEREKQIQTLNAIIDKSNANKELTKDEIRFLYEIDAPIENFGEYKDPRIEEIIKSRNTIKDYNFLFEGQTSFKGDINLSFLKDAKGLKLPKYLQGNLNLGAIKNINGLELPHSITGGLNLYSIKNAEGVKLPDSIGGDLNLASLQRAAGVKFPNSIKGNLYLNAITEIKDFSLPESIGGNLFLFKLQDAKNIIFPKKIEGSLILTSLKSGEGLRVSNGVKKIILPKSIQGFVPEGYAGVIQYQ